MTVKVNPEAVAVDRDYYYRPMDTCPTGAKVLLLNKYGVAVIGQWNGKDPQWQGWSPMPRIRKEVTPPPPGYDDGLGF